MNIIKHMNSKSCEELKAIVKIVVAEIKSLRVERNLKSEHSINKDQYF